MLFAFKASKKAVLNCYIIIISKPLKVYLLEFKVSEAILIEFCSYKIKSFYIDENELKIPSKIGDNKVKTVRI